MKLGIGSRANDTELRVQDMTFAEFAEKLSKPKIGQKDGLYLIRGGLMHEAKRADANLIEAELVVIDGDSAFDAETGEILPGAPEFGIAAAAFRRSGLAYVIHTTHSNRPGKPKWRAYVPAHMTDPAQLEPCVTQLVESLNADGCYVTQTRECSAWSQAWFTPRVPTEEALEWFQFDAVIDGRAFDVEAAVNAYHRRSKVEGTVAKTRERPQQGVHGDGPIDTFNKAATIGLVRQMLEDAGYKFAFKRGDSLRFMAPSSETRTAGVVVLKGKQRGDIVIYSHHGAHDPLSGRLTDAFGLLWHVTHRGNQEAALEDAMCAVNWKKKADPLADFDALEIDAEDFAKARADAEKPAGPKGPLFIPAKAFAEGWKAAEYLVDGLIQRGYCYSLTSPTGHGKTAVILTLAACLGTGRSFGGAETMPGRVGYFAAENPNDVQARWIGLQEHMGFDDANVFFCPETVDLKTTFDRVTAEAKAAGGFDLIVVDTSQAFFSGTDENSNAEMVAHAKAMRRLSTLPGTPCVIILTHPVKNPSKDNLLPRGGGGFLAEVDGNLTIWNDGGNLELHHQGKFRGAGFAPLNFVLKPVTPARLVDAKGRQIPTVVAEYVTEAQYSVLLEDFAKDQDKVMLMILESEGKATVAEMCRRAGWVGKGGVENKAKVHRIIGTLKAAKLVGARRGGKPYLTAAGEEEIKAKAQALGIRTKGRKKPVQDDDDSTF